MDLHYTDEKNILILIGLMKAHKVKKVIISPGSTNITLAASLKQDSYFELYSAPDERSAAYMACGLAAESGEPVALSCTGATASRNYIPGMTEAFYRKLPILAITSTQHLGQVGHYVQQVIDRSEQLNDLVNLSVQIPIIHDDMDAWSVNVTLNKALLELRHRGGGPVHINLTTSYPFYPVSFSTKELPSTRVIHRIEYGQNLPQLDDGKIAIFVGNHVVMDTNLTNSIEQFCKKNNAVVLCDHTSNYTGESGISASLVTSQDTYTPTCVNMDILIHIGQISGAYMNLNPGQVWRVNPDGEIRDTFRKLKYVFEMKEVDFFDNYNKLSTVDSSDTYYKNWEYEYKKLEQKISDLPFSNIWLAQQTFSKLPINSYLHLGILNSLRAWNFCPLRKDIKCFSNTGGFGIDGLISSLVGAALADSKQLHYLVIGDLAFFYDMNVLGNRHFSPSIRIMLVNNGKGTEFRNYTNFASKFGNEADTFIAAGGHYGNKSCRLVKHYAEDLGFEYLTANTKDEYEKSLERFCFSKITEKPMLLEVFTNNEDEDEALHIMRNLATTKSSSIKRAAKDVMKEVLGSNNVQTLKKIIRS
ncbi:MAG: thiamine pyrophosphate-binding protein [[Clostridium] innocuum]